RGRGPKLFALGAGSTGPLPSAPALPFAVTFAALSLVAGDPAVVLFRLFFLFAIAHAVITRSDPRCQPCLSVWCVVSPWCHSIVLVPALLSLRFWRREHGDGRCTRRSIGDF